MLRDMPRVAFSKSTLAILAVDEFVKLATATERAQWAKDHGVDRPLSEHLVKAVRQMHARRAENARMGLPDPLR